MKVGHKSMPIGFRLAALVNVWWERLVQLAFGLFIGGLVALLVLLYAGVQII
jgi:hypothetical protein